MLNPILLTLFNSIHRAKNLHLLSNSFCTIYKQHLNRKMKLKNKYWSYTLVAMFIMLVSLSFSFTHPNRAGATVVAKSATTKSLVDEKKGLYDSLELSS